MAEEARRLMANAQLMLKLSELIREALDGGLSVDDVKAVLERCSELLDDE